MTEPADGRKGNQAVNWTAGNRTGPLIIFLFLLNLLAGLFLINEGLFHYDSVLLAEAVEKTYETGHLQRAVRGRYGSVIVNSILYLPFFLLGYNADFTTRFSSVLFHSLSVIALFLFIYELFGRRVQAFFGALLLSFTPFYFSPNTYGKEHGMSVFFLLMAFYLLVRGIKKRSLLFTGLSGFTMAFAVSVKESILVTVPLYFLLYLKPEISFSPFRVAVPAEKFRPKTLFPAVLPFLAVFSVMYFTYLDAEISKEIVLRDTGTAAFLGLYTPMFRTAVSDLTASLPLLLFPAVIAGIVRTCQKEDLFLTIFLLLWSLLIFYFGNTQSYGARYLDVVIIPLYIFASYALCDLYDRKRIIAFALMIYFLAGMFVFMYPMLEFRHDYNGAKQFALYIKEKTEENAVIITSDDRPFIRYYGNRQAISHPLNPGGYSKEMKDFVKKIEDLLTAKVPVYLMWSGFPISNYDDHGFFWMIMTIKFRVSAVGERPAEDYHRPDMKLDVRPNKLFRLNLAQSNERGQAQTG